MINYAVIGCGVISHVHCLSIIKQKDSRLHSVCDHIKNRADKLAAEYECKAVYDYDDLLRCAEIDVISICLPHHEHFEFYKKAIEAGKNVITEKPMAIFKEHLYEMVKLSQCSGNKTTVAFQHRYSKLVRALKSFIYGGLIGEITGGNIKFYCCRSMEYYNSDSWRGKWKTEGGGTLINQAIHTIDLANFFLGNPVFVDGICQNRLHKEIEVEDFAEGIVYYSKNKILNLHVENSPYKDWEPLLEITGSKGSFVLKGSDSLVELHSIAENKDDIYKALKEIELSMEKDKIVIGKPCYGDLHLRLIDDFTNAIINNRDPYVSVADASMANHIVLNLYENFRD